MKDYSGIFLISVASLSLEVFLIRFFSIAQWYHFAFMVVSIALFGIAASGVFLSIKKIKNPSTVSSLFFSLTTLLGFFILNNVSFDPYEAILNPSYLLILLIYYLLLGLPFFFFGLIIAYFFQKNQQNAGKIYFYNLSGSALGTLSVLPIISFLGPYTIVVIAMLGLLAGLFFTKKKITFLALIFSVSFLFFVPLDINLSKYKELNQALSYPDSVLLSTKYNSFSRVDVINSSFTRYAPGLSSEFKGILPEQIGITVDGANMNAITNLNNLDFVDYLPTSLAFTLVHNPKVLVINAGAGLDVLSALTKNATITVVESNPIIVNLLKNEYKEFSGGIYNRAHVDIDEGRNFIKRAEKYDVIIISVAGNVLGSVGGIYSLSENYLLTKEAMRDYYNHLTDNGVLVITRWLLYPPKESLRLFTLALPYSKENIALIRSWTTVTLLLSKQKLTEEDIKNIEDFTEKNKFDIIYMPANFTPNKYAKFDEPYYYLSLIHI